MSMVLAPAGLLCLSLLERLVFCVRMLLLYSIIIQPLNHSQFRSLIEFNYASVIVINIPFILDCSSDTECFFCLEAAALHFSLAFIVFFNGVHPFRRFSSISKVFVNFDGVHGFRRGSSFRGFSVISKVFLNLLHCFHRFVHRLHHMFHCIQGFSMDFIDFPQFSRFSMVFILLPCFSVIC